jgi:hypothetical protein
MADGFGELSQRFSKMEARSKELASELTFLDNTIDQWDANKLAEKVAYVTAVDEISNNAFEILRAYTLKACIDSEEYNYPPYINHLMGALKSNENEIIKLLPTKAPYLSGNSVVKVDFSVLGGIEEWADITETVRGVLGVGKSKIEAASRMWREKIYRAGREGGKVPRRIKNKEGGYDVVDITADYVDRYAMTIDLRLSYLPGNKAPFWYLIEYGNASSAMSRGGKAYPIVKAQNFVDTIEKVIQAEFSALFTSFRTEAQRLVNEFFKVNKIESQVTKELEALAIGIKSGEINYKEVGQKAQKSLKTVNGIYEFYTSSTGKSLSRLHGAGGKWAKDALRTK